MRNSLPPWKEEFKSARKNSSKAVYEIHRMVKILSGGLIAPIRCWAFIVFQFVQRSDENSSRGIYLFLSESDVCELLAIINMCQNITVAIIRFRTYDVARVAIAKCYNYYHSSRVRTVHFGVGMWNHRKRIKKFKLLNSNIILKKFQVFISVCKISVFNLSSYIKYNQLKYIVGNHTFIIMFYKCSFQNIFVLFVIYGLGLKYNINLLWVNAECNIFCKLLFFFNFLHLFLLVEKEFKLIFAFVFLIVYFF